LGVFVTVAAVGGFAIAGFWQFSGRAANRSSPFFGKRMSIFCFLFRGFSNSIIEFPNRIDGMLIDFNDDIALLEIFCAACKFGFTFTISTPLTL